MTSQAAGAVTAAGSETARYYDEYGRQLYRYCLARLRSPEEAEDALQTIFVRVYGALGKGVRPRFEAAWVYKIAQNVCVTRSAIAGRRAQHETPVDFTELDVASTEHETDVLLELEPALASMPKNLRDAILLREWQGLSYAEIANELDTTVSAVETLIFRARRHLASALRPAGSAILDGLSLRALVSRLRGAFASAGTAKVAVGTAVVAVAGAGVTSAVSRADHPPAVRHDAVTHVERQMRQTPPLVVHQERQHPRATRATAAFPVTVGTAAPVARKHSAASAHPAPPSAASPPASTASAPPEAAPTPAAPPAVVVPTVVAAPAVAVPTIAPTDLPTTTEIVATATTAVATVTTPTVTATVPLPPPPPPPPVLP